MNSHNVEPETPNPSGVERAAMSRLECVSAYTATSLHFTEEKFARPILVGGLGFRVLGHVASPRAAGKLWL